MNSIIADMKNKEIEFYMDENIDSSIDKKTNKPFICKLVTTEGMPKNYFECIFSKIHTNTLKNNKGEDKFLYCITCDKYYSTEIMIEYDFGEKPDNLCKHCIWIINEEPKLRHNLDKELSQNNNGLYKYLTECCKDHDITKCIRHKNNVTCLLCDYKAGKKIDMILPENMREMEEIEEMEEQIQNKRNNINAFTKLKL